MADFNLTKRKYTKQVLVGDVKIGGNAPIVVQSMTDTDTVNVLKTTEQVILLAKAGSEIVRLTVNNDQAAKSVYEIKSRINDLGYNIPLVGDFHFIGHRLLKDNPSLIKSLDKLRINPGNVGRGAKHDENFSSFVNLAKEYNVDTKNKHKIDIIKTLLFSVDIIPNSIVIAQAANESGWGTSRFATEYNALFGEYTFNDSNGVVPNLREKGQTHLVKFFPSVNESIKSYFKNINTHTAYNDFRLERRKLRVNNSLLDANILVNYLNTYAIDKNYVRTLQLIIRDNKLLNFDNIIITTKS